jgi:acyl homoserine lactone synthase
MHNLRKRVFSDRLGWQVDIRGNAERDQFDELDPIYLLHRTQDIVDGCIRLLPSDGSNMLRDVFPQLSDVPVPSSRQIWESSRFCLDSNACTTVNGVAAGTLDLFLGLIEFGLYMRLTHIMTVTDVRVERILRRSGWPLQRLGSPQCIGNTMAIAGLVETSLTTLKHMRGRANVHGPLLWMPAVQEAA